MEDISLYESARGDLRALAREYVRFTIEDAWPAQRDCRVPPGGGRANALFTRLAEFSPAGPREAAVHQEAMRAFNGFFEARRERIDAVTRGLPATLWCAVVASGLILISLTGLFVLRFGPRPKYLGTAVLLASWGLFMGLRHVVMHAASDIGQGFSVEILGAHTYTWALLAYWVCVIAMGGMFGIKWS